MGIEYDKPRLAGIISDAITNHFLEMIPKSPNAEEVRRILEEGDRGCSSNHCRPPRRL